MLNAKTGIMLAVVAASVVGCDSAMHDENVGLHKQNRELQSQLDSINAQLRDRSDPAQMRALQAELLDRDKKIADLQNRPPQLAAAAEPPAPPVVAPPTSLGGLETTVDARAGTVTVTLPGDVLFDSGKADLLAAAQVSLDKLVSALKRDYAGKLIRVEGHTDSDPITKSKEDWTDNLELSLARAASVSRYLIDHGIVAKKLTTSGFGQSRPRSGNKTRNRRVDVVVVTG